MTALIEYWKQFTNKIDRQCQWNNVNMNIHSFDIQVVKSTL